MASTKDEITAIAVEHGYTGKKPDSIAKAIDALADTLAGTDVKGSRSISGAIHALAPYIGSGGGAELGENVGVACHIPNVGDDGYSSARMMKATIKSGDAVLMVAEADDYGLTPYYPSSQFAEAGGLIVPSGSSVSTTLTLHEDDASAITGVDHVDAYQDSYEHEVTIDATCVLGEDKTLAIMIGEPPSAGCWLEVYFTRSSV